MKGRVDFYYDASNDVVVATPHGLVETEADVVEWFAQCERYLGQFKRRVDLIIVLDDFEIRAAIGPQWEEARARMLAQYAGVRFRVRASTKVSGFAHTSGADPEAETVEAATEGILAARAAAASRGSRP